MQPEGARFESANRASAPLQCVEMAYFGGLTHVEIAASQGTPLSTVKTCIALGLRELAAYLRGQQMDPVSNESTVARDAASPQSRSYVPEAPNATAFRRGSRSGQRARDAA